MKKTIIIEDIRDWNGVVAGLASASKSEFVAGSIVFVGVNFFLTGLLD
jgi:hypothetical protein